MPLEIDINVSSIKKEVLFSKNIELAAAIQLLADPTHHKFADGWISAMSNSISAEGFETLKMLYTMRLHGLELVEFMLRDRIFNDTELLISSMKQYDEVEFIYTFLGEELSRERIAEIKADEGRLRALEAEASVVFTGDFTGLRRLIYDTEGFRRSVIELIKEMDSVEFHSEIETNQRWYKQAADEMRVKLANAQPLDLAQSIIGRKFLKVYDFKEYYFIPSYFFSPHQIRFYNTELQVIIYDARRSKLSEDEVGDRVSELLKTISDRKRMEILKCLSAGTSYGKALAEKLNLTTATISHHLEQLKAIGLIKEERVKNIKYFKANAEEIERLFKQAKNYLLNINDEDSKKKKEKH